MSGTPNPATVPSHLRPLFDDTVRRFGPPVRLARSGPNKPWVFVLADHVVYLAPDTSAREALSEEVERLQWARGQSIPVPEVVEIGVHHMIVDRAARDEPRGETYVNLAIEAADRITAASPPKLRPHSGQRRSPRRTLPVRALKMAIGLINPREFVEARRRAYALDRNVLGHGDFHPNNVLFDSARASVCVIDWTYCGLHPASTDLLFFWSQLKDLADRKIVFDAAVDRSEDKAALADLHHWIALRTLVEAVTGLSLKSWNRRMLERHRVVLEEARTNVARIRSATSDVST